jgi:hypothetical protein
LVIAEYEPTAEAEDGGDQRAEERHEDEQDDERGNDCADVHGCAPSLAAFTR